MMHIAFCTDTNYVMPTGVAMVSICENNRDEKIIFHLVITDEGTAPDEVEKKVAPLKDIAYKYGQVVEVYRMDAEKIKAFICTGNNHVSTTAFARIFLPELISEDINKILYLDCDIVCDGSLRELWDIEMEDDCPVGAVVDCNYAAPSYHLQCEIPQSAYYCNSGVLLMNLDSWRKNNYIEECVNCAIEKNYPLLDQDVINHVFCGKIKYLPVKYNVLLVTLMDGIDRCHVTLDLYDEIKQACQQPVIIHYLSSNKPWKNEFCPKREVWEKYKNLSIWKDFKPTSVVTRFDRTYQFKELNEVYWIDAILFNQGLAPYLRLFRAATRLKNKGRFIKISSKFLNAFATFLEKVYAWKTK